MSKPKELAAVVTQAEQPKAESKTKERPPTIDSIVARVTGRPPEAAKKLASLLSPAESDALTKAYNARSGARDVMQSILDRIENEKIAAARSEKPVAS